jgi:hypothetical protein
MNNEIYNDSRKHKKNLEDISMSTADDMINNN